MWREGLRGIALIATYGPWKESPSHAHTTTFEKQWRSLQNEVEADMADDTGDYVRAMRQADSETWASRKQAFEAYQKFEDETMETGFCRAVWPIPLLNEIDNIFEPFRRLRTERTGSDKGVGLGLSIARSVARAHGGRIEAEPREGGGLVMRVTLLV